MTEKRELLGFLNSEIAADLFGEEVVYFCVLGNR